MIHNADGTVILWPLQHKTRICPGHVQGRRIEAFLPRGRQRNRVCNRFIVENKEDIDV